MTITCISRSTNLYWAIGRREILFWCTSYYNPLRLALMHQFLKTCCPTPAPYPSPAPSPLLRHNLANNIGRFRCTIWTRIDLTPPFSLLQSHDTLMFLQIKLSSFYESVETIVTVLNAQFPAKIHIDSKQFSKHVKIYVESSAAAIQRIAYC